MYPRTEYEMSQHDLEELLSVMRAVPVMMVGGYDTSQIQQNAANAAWAKLGTKMGFDAMTVRPVDGKGQRFFSAIPSEPEEARKERLARDVEEKRKQEIRTLQSEIDERHARLNALTK
jgi:hypothetical protein